MLVSLGTSLEYKYKDTLYSAQATVTEYPRLSGLNNKNVFSHSPRVWKSKIKVSSGLVSGEASLPGLQMAFLSLSFHSKEKHDLLVSSLFLQGHLCCHLEASPL